MTPEQQLFWDTLRDDPVVFAHKTGMEMYQVWQKAKQSKKKVPTKFHRLADKYTYHILATHNMERIVRTMITWMNMYQLPFVPGKMKAFGEFHRVAEAYIMNMGNLPTSARPTGYKL